MKQIIIFIIFICILYAIFFDYNSWFNVEHFNQSDKIKFKKNYDI